MFEPHSSQRFRGRGSRVAASGEFERQHHVFECRQ
jgi:hypothetical protein